jgi:hypothetical protein
MSNPEFSTNPGVVADQQRVLGAEWADLYAAEPLTSAEIAMRNPANYLHDVDLYSLPEHLQERWSALVDTADVIVEAAEITKSEWGLGINGIDKLQHRMLEGQLDPSYRERVAQVIRDASTLFADSSVIRRGNTEYYAGNILGMATWIKQYTD